MPGADELFPIIIYCIMSSNPPNLQANLDFISEYLSHERKMNREGFVLTNVMAAIDFLKNIDSKELLKGNVKLKEKERQKRSGRWARKQKEREKKKKMEERNKDFEKVEAIELEDSGDDEQRNGNEEKADGKEEV